MPKENKTDKIELKQNIDITFKAIEYFNTLGIEILEYTDGSSILKLPFDKKLTQPFGIMHGGALFSLADGACALAILSTMKEIKPFVTAEMKINYLEPVNSGDTFAYARVLRKGRVVPIEVELKNSGILVAKAISTYIILDSKK